MRIARVGALAEASVGRQRSAFSVAVTHIINRAADIFREVLIELARLAFVHGPRRHSVRFQALFLDLIRGRSQAQIRRMEGRIR